VITALALLIARTNAEVVIAVTITSSFLNFPLPFKENTSEGVTT
jgi:hypothetical protein